MFWIIIVDGFILSFIPINYVMYLGEIKNLLYFLLRILENTLIGLNIKQNNYWYFIISKACWSPCEDCWNSKLQAKVSYDNRPLCQLLIYANIVVYIWHQFMPLELWNATNHASEAGGSPQPRPGAIRRAHFWIRRLIDFLELCHCVAAYFRQHMLVTGLELQWAVMNDQQLALPRCRLPACLLTRLISGLINYLQPSDAERRFCLLIKSAQESVAFPWAKLELRLCVYMTCSSTGCNVDGLPWWGLRN